jgi:TatD DNase family protein
MELIDTHCHLDEERFDEDLDEVIARALAANVELMVTVGTDAASSRIAVGLAEEYESVLATVGIHPHEAHEATAANWSQIERYLDHARVVAVGETGLDFARDRTRPAAQLQALRRHLELARQCGKPIILHCREAEAELLQELERAAAAAGGPIRGVMHCFSGSAHTARRAIELGLHVSFAGQITYKNRKFRPLHELVRSIPPDRLLLETDSPYLSPEPYRGRRNEPARIIHTLHRLAQLLERPVAEVAELCAENARRLFDLPNNAKQP